MSWNLRESGATWKSTMWTIQSELSNREQRPKIQLANSDPSRRIGIELVPCECSDLNAATNHATGLPLGDAYVRQNDLIAYFPETLPWRYGYQLDTRVLSTPGSSLVVEFWLSIQTSLLDAHPQLEIRLTGQAFASRNIGAWVDLTNHSGLLIHPLDRLDCPVSETAQGLQVAAFGRFMEKGVIRRMRFRLVVSSRPEADSFWQSQYEEFSESPLPLTT